ncbi:MAG TPA: proline--tRNA ligase [Anaerolineales bacterium]|nr:proline--tRNA ligase [Anaerolineales bacterium]HMX17974.1 proline--tRNA ligase [Anaerolineales bacterium]HMX73039.1 proline--tRNA ligase [Anaerolineales bacterium]HMZ41693.1 proline--tRNA ligase [Anaerolineales bacterium]HNA53213.1 proline--tRNA ligase [Anaerolineales bacterium]
MAEEKLTTRAEDFSEWYNQLVIRADMADYAPVRGCMVVKPYGWALWENITSWLDAEFKKTGHVNAAFPTLIPMSFFEKEKDHVEGFAPELAVVTHGGGEELEEKLAVRPTSETIIGHMYSKWVKSWRDLPILIVQWGSVLRWELRTKLFLRTAEFYWHEGHTAHSSEAEAKEEMYRILDIYERFCLEEAAIPVFKGTKSDTERFAGAQITTSIEAMMWDKRALQSGTSHYFGDNFAKAFEIQYLDKNNKLTYAQTTSWAISSRIIGAMIMVHGDDNGLVLPPRLAPIQAVVVPIFKSDEEKAKVLEVADRIFAELKAAGVRVKFDDRDNVSSGFKFNDWEMRGVPVRVEIGPKDVEKGTVALARRDRPGKEGKAFVSQANLDSTVKGLLDEIQASLLKRATEYRDANIHNVTTFDELKEVVKDGWAFAYWCESRECEAKAKEETKATTRNIPFDQPNEEGACVVCGKPSKRKVYFAKAY